MTYVVKVLRGANSQRIRENVHDRLPVYGISRDHSNEHWMSVLRQLIHLGMVSQNITVPPYVVFNDATLLEMAEQLPTDSGQMLRINGVVNRKLESFGLLFLALIREHLSDEDLTLPVR